MIGKAFQIHGVHISRKCIESWNFYSLRIAIKPFFRQDVVNSRFLKHAIFNSVALGKTHMFKISYFFSTTTKNSKFEPVT